MPYLVNKQQRGENMSNQSTTAMIKANEKIINQLEKIKQGFNKLKNTTVTATVNLKDRTSTQLGKITRKIGNIKTKTISIKVKNVIDKGTDVIKDFYQKHGDNIKDFAKGSITAAQAQAGNEMKLASTLKLRTKASKEQINSILKLTSAQQQNGVVSDEVQMAGAGQLAAYAGNAKSIKTLIPAMNNLLVAQKGLNGTSDDAVAVADLMGQGLNGQTEGLKAAGLAFSQAQANVIEYGTEEERAAMLANIIADNVGNANAAMAGTDVGAIQQAQNLFTDLQEQIGAIVLPYLGQFAKWFSENQPMIKGIVDSIAEGISSAAQKVFDFFQKVADFISKHQEAILFLITFVGVLAGLIGIISPIASVITTVTTVIGILTAAQTLFNIQLGLCPIILIILAIAAVIAAIVGLIVYWDEVKEAAASVWESVTGYFGNLKDSVVGFFSDMVSGIKEHWNAIIDFLKNPIKGAAEFISEHTTKGEKGTGKTGGKTPKGTGGGVAAYKALGTPYWKGGLTHINERGGEIVDLPNGSRVIPADKSQRMMDSGSVSFGNIYITAKGVTANEVANEIVPLLKLKLANI